MSLYNMLFGMNAQTDLLLAVIGFRKVDVERFRNVYVEDDGATIAVYTRTGGGNRPDYPQEKLYQSPLIKGSADDDFDNTYATFHFSVPDEYIEDVRALADPLANGLRKEFAQHLAKTLSREPTESDLESAAYEKEQQDLSRVGHFKANGHTFVPLSDDAMENALKIAEANDGDLRTAWGILPLRITIQTDFCNTPGAKDPRRTSALTRVKTHYAWEIDEAYWRHCQERFTADYPKSMSKVAEDVERHLSNKKSA